jgi:hypothetical protein
MKTLKNYIIETAKQNEDIALDTYIYEGFLDKLKDAIENIVDNPKKYFDEVKNNLQKLKDDKNIKHYFPKKDPEKVAEELDKLNNDEDLKAIYKHTKEIVNDEYSELYNSLVSLTRGPQKVLEYIEKNFDNCDENKAYAIFQIMQALALAIIKQQRENSKSSSSSSYGGSSRSSSSKTAARIAAASAVAIALRR